MSGDGVDKASVSQKIKRPAMDKQQAYLEYKQGPGAVIEQNIVQCRNDMKTKRTNIKDMTTKINTCKSEIDRVKQKLDKKEEERRMQSRALRNEMAIDAFDDDEIQHEVIIDEEELVMLKEMKDLKRDYRDNFTKLKGLKQDLSNLQDNINSAKEQMIYRFENWYCEEFEAGAISSMPQAQINLEEVTQQRAGLTSAGHDATPVS